MKRMVAFLLATALLFALSGCGAEKEDGVQQTDAGNSVQQTQPDATEIPVETKVQEENTVIATTTEEFMEVLGNYVNLEDYEVDAEEEGEVWLYLTEEASKDVDTQLDYTLTMSDGSVITLPCHFQDLVDAGWNSDEESRGEWPANSMWSSEFTNADGLSIELRWVNESDTATTDISQIIYDVVRVYLYEENMDTEKLEKNPKAPGFVLAGGVTNNSGLSEIISSIGVPTDIYFYEPSMYYAVPTIALSFYNYVGESQGDLEIEINALTNEIIEISYQVFD